MTGARAAAADEHRTAAGIVREMETPRGRAPGWVKLEPGRGRTGRRAGRLPAFRDSEIIVAVQAPFRRPNARVVAMAHGAIREDLQMAMTVVEAQSDMRRGYYSGATGILASAFAWAASAATAVAHSPERAIWVLLGGGMLIYPLGLLACRLLGAPGRHAKGNPLGQLAGSSTFWLIFSLPLAYVLGLHQAAWFFSAMLLVIGGRYLVFATLYGMRLYWALGLALAAAGAGLAVLQAPPFVIVLAGAAIELVFGITAVVQHRGWMRPDDSVTPTPFREAA